MWIRDGQSVSRCGFVTFLWLVGAITEEMLKLLLHWRWFTGSGVDSRCDYWGICEPAVQLQKQLWERGSSVKLCPSAQLGCLCLGVWQSREKFVFWCLTFSESVTSAGLSLGECGLVQTDTCSAWLLKEKNVFWRLCMSAEGILITAVSEDG